MKYENINTVIQISLSGLVSCHRSSWVEFIWRRLLLVFPLLLAAFQFLAALLQDTSDIRASLLRRMMYRALEHRVHEPFFPQATTMLEIP